MTPKQVLLLAFLLNTAAYAQTPAQPPQTLTGCVARLPVKVERYVLANGGRCMLLAGSFNAAQIADHEITAKGILLEPEGMAPLTFNVQSVVATKAACSKTCVLEPPGTRGVHGKEQAGKEGATRGVTDIKPAGSPN